VGFGVQVRQGFLHVWGNAGADAAAEAAARPPLLVPELDPDAAAAVMRDGSATLDSGKRYMRDLPYGFDFLVENLVDPAHVNFAHNGVIGSRCAWAAGLPPRSILSAFVLATCSDREPAKIVLFLHVLTTMLMQFGVLGAFFLHCSLLCSPLHKSTRKLFTRA